MTTANSRSIFDIEEDAELEASLDAEAEASYEAGRVVPHAKVVAWLKSWGSAEELPCPLPEAPQPERN